MAYELLSQSRKLYNWGEGSNKRGGGGVGDFSEKNKRGDAY